MVIHGVGDHFSSGLDLSELTEHDATEGLRHSQMWHRVFDRIQYSRIPVIAALKGAVIGGGLELACAAHIRVAEPSAYFALPEGQRGIFVGGGGSVRLPRLIGVARMIDMMLTGRVYSATEGVGLWLLAIPHRSRRRAAEGAGTGGTGGCERAADQFRRAAGVADDRGGQSADRPADGIPDGDGGAERQRGKAPHSRVSRPQDRKGEADLT